MSDKKIDFIQGLLSAENKRRFDNHPLHHRKTQREFCGQIVEEWLNSPTARMAEMFQRLVHLETRVNWMAGQPESIRALETRVKNLESNANIESETSTAVPA